MGDTWPPLEVTSGSVGGLESDLCSLGGHLGDTWPPLEVTSGSVGGPQGVNGGYFGPKRMHYTASEGCFECNLSLFQKTFIFLTDLNDFLIP